MPSSFQTLPSFNGDAFDCSSCLRSFVSRVRKHTLLVFEKGGDLLTTGGYAFDRLWLKGDGHGFPPASIGKRNGTRLATPSTQWRPMAGSKTAPTDGGPPIRPPQR